MKKIWGIFWIVAALLGISALWSIHQLPSESRNAILFGMSGIKLAMCGGIFILILICMTGAFYSFSKEDSSFSTGKAAGISSYIIIFFLILGLIFLTPPIGRTALERSLLERLTPLMYWGIAFSGLAFLFSIVQKFRRIRTYQVSSLPALIWGLVFFLSSSGMLFYALASGTGLDPVSRTFYRQGVSLLEGHIGLPLLFLYPVLPVYLLIRAKTSKTAAILISILAAAGIWAAAFMIWVNIPFEGRSYFAPALRLPNNNFYPASDAENYDMLAQSILLGNGFRCGMTVVRPLYAAFLALLHILFGNDYILLTNGQIFVLALIPVLVFMIGKCLRHTDAGLLAAAWIICREVYSIRLSPIVQVSNSRLLMSDLPTMLLVLCVVLCVGMWYRHDQSAVRALFCGGFIGLAMLIRTQCFVLIPAVIFLFICSGKKAGSIWKSVFVSIFGTVLVFAPWTLWMNAHPNTTVNTEVSESNYLLNLYRTAAGEPGSEAGLFDVIKTHPAEVFQAVGSHFLNNEISSLLVLPVREVKDLETDRLFFEDDLFWYRENARETIEKNQTLILIYLVIISFGVISAFRKAGFAGLAPLVIHLVYNLGNAFAMTSGFRFILPADWVFVFYFAFGCSAILRFVIRTLLFAPTETKEPVFPKRIMPSYGKAFLFIFSCLILSAAGLILPFCDSRIPRRFETKTHEEIAAEWKGISALSEMILSRYTEDELVFLEGRAFYPRFYKAGEGDSGGNSAAKRGLDMDRLVWMFQDDRVHVLNCPIDSEQAGELLHPYKDPIDILAVGLEREDYIEVLEMTDITPSGAH